jgi:uncharacterized iron-regulated membrane protein
MFTSFRLSMTWVHTWLGLVLGYVLMACFFFGALSVFDREIDRWTIPETRFEPQPMPSFDKMLLPIFTSIEGSEESYEFAQEEVVGTLPPRESLKLSDFSAYTTHRDPVLGLFASFDVPNQPKDYPVVDHVHVFGNATIDPRNGAVISNDKLAIGSEFFYPLHYSLHLEWMELGYWIVGLAALVMLVALVTGVIMHRKFFREFFTFRPKKQTQRSVLDLHNLTGVVALPFHFFFAFTGLVIFAGIYLPVTERMFRAEHEMHEKLEEAQTGLPHDPAGVAAPLASVDAMVEEAQRRWAARDMAGEVGFLGITHYGDANGYVSVYRAGTDRVTLTGQGIHFRASTGELLREDPQPSAVGGVNDWLAGLHLQHFRHWMLRWLYVLGGLAGCVCIATGFIFFVEKRKRQHAKAGHTGARWVDAFAVTTVTGMLIAAATMLGANRLLPEALPGRGDWEERIFWFAWLAALLHAAWRSAPVARSKISPAWREQSWVVAALCIAAPVLNWLTTGDHLIKTIAQQYWPVAGLDLALLFSAGIAAYAARRLRRAEVAGSESTSEREQMEIAHA